MERNTFNNYKSLKQLKNIKKYELSTLNIISTEKQKQFMKTIDRLSLQLFFEDDTCLPQRHQTFINNGYENLS